MDNLDQELKQLQEKLRSRHSQSFSDSNQGSALADNDEVLGNYISKHESMAAKQSKTSNKAGLEDMIMDLSSHLPENKDMTLGEFLTKKTGIRNQEPVLDNNPMPNIKLPSKEVVSERARILKEKFGSAIDAVEGIQSSETKQEKQAPFITESFVEGIEKINPLKAPIFSCKTTKQSKFLFDKNHKYCNTNMKLVDDENFAPLDLTKFKSK